MPLISRPRPEPLYVALEFAQFPAQVLAAGKRPLRGKAFAVVRQSGDSHKAAVYAVSAAARELGVDPGMPVFVLRRKFGGKVQVVGRDEGMEDRVVRRLQELCESWTPDFEVGRWGTCLLDLAGSPLQRQMAWEAVADLVRARMQDGTGLSEVAVGASASPLVARALARGARPRGVEVCPPGEEMEALAELELEALPGLHGGARDRLRRYGIESVEQVRQLERPALVKRLGRADGEGVYGLVRGWSCGGAAGSATR
ncbi:MAG: hypothetical protein ABIL09_29375 [Gemmatimonadota bacterium]